MSGGKNTFFFFLISNTIVIRVLANVFWVSSMEGGRYMYWNKCYELRNRWNGSDRIYSNEQHSYFNCRKAQTSKSTWKQSILKEWISKGKVQLNTYRVYNYGRPDTLSQEDKFVNCNTINLFVRLESWGSLKPTLYTHFFFKFTFYWKNSNEVM